jgi:hypothetical protein
MKNEGPDIVTDVAIHFCHPSELIDGAVNILYFQQFFEYEKHNLHEYKDIYDFILTPGEELAREFSFVHYWPLAVSQTQMELAETFPTGDRSGVVFIGNERMRTESQYKTALLPFVSELNVYGSGWDSKKYPFLQDCLKGVCGINDTPRIYAGALAAITIHRHEYNQRFGLATNRTFHAILNGCVVFSDINKSLMKLMGEGRGVVFLEDQAFRSAATNVRERWLEEQEAIKVGKQHILGAHRWSHRLLELEEILGGR